MDFNNNSNKENVLKTVADFLTEKKLAVETFDFNRPWGGFFVIEENNASEFVKLFFAHLSISDLKIAGKLSPKILVVAPNKRLSWQYHHRRAEIWKLIAGKAAVMVSDTDEETEIINLAKGDIIELKKGERHRLIGTENWGVIAEIWRHTDAENPSDEDDIVRLQDDFGRQ